ncbi:MAG: class I SAM-dependent methyltransferase [Bacteroidota bacterium]
MQENEHATGTAFTRQAPVFDELYRNNAIIDYKRNRVRAHLLAYLKTDSHILELNSGTGADALFLAQRGFTVHATDLSVGMQAVLQQKVLQQQLENSVSNEICSYTELHLLKHKGPYNHIFSNFAGLNCTAELAEVLQSFSGLLKPNGIVTLVILPKFCLWETLLIFKGKFKTAFRRFLSAKGRAAHLEGVWFKCWYYNPSFVKKSLKEEFEVLAVEGLCSIVPPSYFVGFAEKYPHVYLLLCRLENKLKSIWPFKVMGDYYIISLRKK